MKARDLMTTQLVYCRLEDPARLAARLMEENNCGLLPVVDPAQSNRLVGVVTDRDLALRVVAQGWSPETSIQTIMTCGAIATCRPDDNKEEVVRLMTTNQVRRIPVTDDIGQCVGIVAQADLARNMSAIGHTDFAQLLGIISQNSSSVLFPGLGGEVVAEGPHESGQGTDD